MRYVLHITRKSDSDGSETAVDADGRFEGGALILDYLSDGAENRLILSNDKMTHERFGEIGLKMEFDPTRSTLCAVNGCGLRGGFYVTTHLLKVKLSASGSRARCVYSGDDGVRTQITVSVRPLNR